MVINHIIFSHRISFDMKRKIAGFLVLIVGLTLAPVALINAAPVIQHWQTANGARVYFVPAPELPMVDVSVIFDAGGARATKVKVAFRNSPAVCWKMVPAI